MKISFNKLYSLQKGYITWRIASESEVITSHPTWKLAGQQVAPVLAGACSRQPEWLTAGNTIPQWRCLLQECNQHYDTKAGLHCHAESTARALYSKFSTLACTVHCLAALHWCPWSQQTRILAQGKTTRTNCQFLICKSQLKISSEHIKDIMIQRTGKM